MSIVLPDPEKWAIRLAGFTRFTILLFTPILAIPLLVSRILPTQPKRFYRVTEDELTLILDASEREGVLEVDEREMINSIFLFRDTTAREIMIPRIDLLALNVETPLLEAMDSMLESGYSRVPVFEESIDNILGVLYIKQGDYDQAEPLLLKAVEGRRHRLGDTHPHSLQSWDHLIGLYEAWGKQEEANKWRTKFQQRQQTS